MSQERITGTILCAIGFLLSINPKLIWKITESWQTEENYVPSERYLSILRIVGGGMLGLGVLLAAGMLK